MVQIAQNYKSRHNQIEITYTIHREDKNKKIMKQISKYQVIISATMKSIVTQGDFSLEAIETYDS